jgi:ribosomal protein S18 acetylase RimI-like enzyme
VSTPAADVSVRPARPEDTAAVAEVQVDAWRTNYAPRLPAGTLDGLDETLIEAGWRAAVTSPPSPAHRLLVSTSTGRVSGYVAVGPAEDGDATSEDGELYALTVAPAEQRLGHGSRLVAAAVELLKGNGFRRARIWTFDADSPLHEFLSGAGWESDGAVRVLDMGEDVGQQRWHTDLIED